MTRGVLIVGSGKRVRETALPAFARMEPDLEVRAVYAKHAKAIEVQGRTWRVHAFSGFGPDDLAGIDLVYVAVGKDAAPSVLARLAASGVSGVDLLIDTPVVRFKHFRHARRASAFRSAWVAEDAVHLPWLDAVRAAVDAGLLGELRRVVFHRSAWAYHGVATAKALLGSDRVSRGRRRRGPAGTTERELVLANGLRAVMVEPRDYSAGHVLVEGTRATLADREGAGDLLLAPVAGADGVWTGFRAGSVETRLDADESAVVGPPSSSGGTPTSRTEDLKRAGFLRLLRAIRDGRGAYPLAAGLDDMVVDYHLERLGRFVDNPFTSPRGALGRLVLSALSLPGGG